MKIAVLGRGNVGGGLGDLGDEEARGVVEQLNRDAGYEPVHMGGLDKAATQEHGIDIIFAIAQTTGPFVYRIAPPEQL